MVTSKDADDSKVSKCDKEGYLQIISNDQKNMRKAYIVKCSLINRY